MATSNERAGKKNAGNRHSAPTIWRDLVDRSVSLAKRGSTPVPSVDTATSPPDRMPNDPMTAAIEAELIAQLLVAHTSGSDPLTVAGIAPDNQKAKAKSLDELPLELDAGDLLAEIEALIDAGVSVETVCVEVLAPSARYLGEMWERDECDFVEVTMGLWRLQEVMREIVDRAPGKAPSEANERVAVFAPLPGDDHSFGAQMIDQVFARAGWTSSALIAPTSRDLLDCVAKQKVDLVGLTVSHDCSIRALRSLIQAMRSVSANPHMRVIIGGHTVNTTPGIVAEVGADGTGVDAKAALKLAERLILAAPSRAHTLT